MISIFAKPPYIIRHLQRVSTIIRGEQITSRMHDARLNPDSGYEKDVCIYVKPHVKPGDEHKFEGKPYIDIIDGFELRHLLRMHPDVGCITISKHDEAIMKKYIKNEVVCIPQHHLNFERATQLRDEIKVIGVVGSAGAFQFIPDKIKKELTKRGIELREHSIFHPRDAVSRFYQSIDLQLIWRPYKKTLANPLKIVNASSFGVPTIALDESAFYEMKGCYIPVTKIEELIEKIDILMKDRSVYLEMRDYCLAKAEEYHIDNICKMYRKL